MVSEVYEKRREQMFPRLTLRQIARIEPHCQRVVTSVGDVLVEPGDADRKLIVVLSGTLEGDVLSMDGEHLRAIVQTDAELSEILMRAFILRRMGLISSSHGEVMVIGSRHSANTLQLREFLTRNAYPHVSVDIDNDAGVPELFERFQWISWERAAGRFRPKTSPAGAAHPPQARASAPSPRSSAASWSRTTCSAAAR